MPGVLLAVNAAITVPPARPPPEVGLTSHKHTTRPLHTLSGPTKQAEPDSKVVTAYAKSAPAPGGAQYLPGLNPPAGKPPWSGRDASGVRDAVE